jgi:hypothetical protein
MTKDRIVGVALGAALCVVVIAGNMRRADTHLVSVYPDVISGIIAPLVVYVVGRRRRLRGESAVAVQRFGLRVGGIAGAVFAAGLAAFTGYWLAATPLLAIGSAAAFGSVFLLSCLAAYAAGQTRIIAV